MRDHTDPSKKSDPRGTAPALVKAPAPELPRGGGAIRGIGEKFSASTFTGTGSMVVPIPTTPGRGGFHPELSLAYDSGSGNGPFGVGWRLSVPSISRKTDKRLPEYRDVEESDVYLLSGAEDLVPAPAPLPPRDGVRIRRYRPRIEGLFARIERHEQIATGDTHWEAVTAGNVRNVYGHSVGARIAQGGRVFSWLLERSEDALGNVISYEYAAEDLAGVPAGPAEVHRLDGATEVTNRYLKRIRYGNAVPGSDADCRFEVVLDYGEHDAARPMPAPAPGATWPARSDPFSVYRAGFEVRTYRLCRRVLMFHRFPEVGDEPVLVRATRFGYDERTTLTRLASIVEEGHVREPALATPPLSFTYGEPELHTAIGRIETTRLDLANGRDQWADLDGEGIPGVLTDDGGALWYRRNLGGGALDPPRCLMTRPSTTALAGGGGAQQLMSLGGDGRLDLVALGPPMSGFHGRVDGDWEPFQPFASLPAITWTDASTRFIDLNGDGIDDVLITGDEVFTWYPSLGREGFAPPRSFPRPRDDRRGPAVAFTDTSHAVLLADLSGDGLRDLVRVGNGSVCYWPNLGHGRFGAMVTMAGAPRFDHPDQFDPKRILFADIDGSGTTDLIYLGHEGVRFWLNQSGNGWGQALELPGLRFDSAVNVSAVDVLGSGTACLAWSSPLPGDALFYVDILGSKKPHLLEAMDNNLGLTMRMRYAPSTRFYLADREAGRPWTTRLPFPVHVLERVESYDAVSRVRFVSEYRYRDGYFDAYEREFRGFGYVEQWDTESDPARSGKGLFADRPPPVNHEYPQPPVVTETWLHTGAWLAGGLPDGPPIELPAGLDHDESRDAHRALKGLVLRQRVRAHDASPLAEQPYRVTDHGYAVRREEPGVFFTHAREVITRHTERDPWDARVQHAVTLEVDACGHVRRSAAIAYPRPAGASDWRPEQGVLVATLSEVDLIDETGRNDWYRHGLPLETRSYELIGINAGAPLAFEEAVTAVAAAEKRLVERTRTRYLDSETLNAPLPWAIIDARALVYESYGLAFTPALLTSLFGGRVTDALLAEGGYVHLDDDADWWVPTGRAVPELPFYQQGEFRDPFGNQSTVRHDDHHLLLVEGTDARGNTVTIENDYRVMAPRLIVDANGNRSSVEVDALARVVAMRIMGKEGSDEGDPDGEPTLKLEYAFHDGVTPSVVHSMARETYGAADTRWQHAYSYSDGSGHEVMQKVQAEPERGTTTPRWIGTGRTVFDNKGNPIKRYEPFFAPTPAYETDEELVQKGVTPILHYDPLGRLVLTEAPDGSTARVVFTPWRQESWDANDTVRDDGNLWYAEHVVSPDAMERRAASLTELHAGTPAVTILDAPGRAIITITDNRPDGTIETRTELDVEGNPLVVWDGLGRAAMRRGFSLLGQPCHQVSVDSGERWMIANVAGHPLRSWDAMGRELATRYDALQRPVRVIVREGAVETLVEETIHGEDAPSARELNVLGRPWRQYDAVGLIEHDRYDFRGNPISVTRRLIARSAGTQDWAASPAPVLEDEAFTQLVDFDALNRPTRMVTPDGSETRHAYNEAGLLDRVEARVVGVDRVMIGAIDYNEKRQRQRIEYGDGAQTVYEYDERTFRLTDLVTTSRVDGAALQQLHYIHDPVGNVLSIQDGAASRVFFDGTVTDGTALYEYDAIYRLTRSQAREMAGGLGDEQRDDRDLPPRPVPHPNDGKAVRPYVEEYGYDAIGNVDWMRHTAVGGFAWTRRYRYVLGTNRLASTSLPGDAADGPYSAIYAHDANGNMTAMPHLPEIDWTFRDQMRGVDRLGGGTVQFGYDGAGQRVRKVWEHGAIVEERIYLGAYEIYRRQEGGALTLERQTLHLMDGERRIALIETKTVANGEAVADPLPRVRFQLGNHLGSVALELDENGGIISYQEHHPFGTTAYRAARADIDVSERRYGYCGKERDEETGLQHYPARYLIPWLGRWASADPAGLVDGPGLYTYAHDNPIRLIDPEGTDDREYSVPPAAAVKVPEPPPPPAGGPEMEKWKAAEHEKDVRNRGMADGAKWGQLQSDVNMFERILRGLRRTPAAIEEARKAGEALLKKMGELPEPPEFENEKDAELYAEGFQKAFIAGSGRDFERQMVVTGIVMAVMTAAGGNRKMGLPRPAYGAFEGTAGNSRFILSKFFKDKYGIAAGEIGWVRYKGGIADFSAVAHKIKGQERALRVLNLTYNREKDTAIVVDALAKEWGWTRTQVSKFLEAGKLRIHHYKPGFIQLVPEKYHKLYHEGGVRWAKLLGIAAATGTSVGISRLLEGTFESRK